LLIVIFLLFIPWVINNGDQIGSFNPLSNETVGNYQSNTCEISLFQFLSIDHVENFEIRFDKSGSINCFSKINGADFFNNKLIVYLGTNLNIDFLLQSSFWLVLISFIPVSEKKMRLKFQDISIFLTTLLFCVHFIAESGYYNLNSKIYSQNFNNNFVLYSLLITVFILLKIFSFLMENRSNSFVEYLPFLFVLVGSYHSLNLNIFLIIFVFIGINFTIQNRKLLFGLFFVIPISSFWVQRISKEFVFFDIDKLNGFSSSAYNPLSILFWSFAYYFLIVGFVNLLNRTYKNLNLERIKFNFLVSGGLLMFLSMISALSTLGNFLIYYFLGLQKTGSKSLESVQENAWRGISSSAESVGEFYAFTILIVAILAIRSKTYRLRNVEYVLLIANIYGLYRSNNFAAFSSLLVLIVIFYLHSNIENKKQLIILTLLTLSFFPVIYITIFNTYSLEDASRKLIKEGLEISYIENLETNEWNLNAVDQNRFLEVLQSQKDKDAVSSSLTYLVEKYHYSDRNYIPNITTTLSTIASPVNRGEKWGVFFGKYDPSVKTFFFGTGVNNIINYYLNHPTTINEGLVLPHSSILSYLIFIGFNGLIVFFGFVLFKIYKNRSNPIYLILLTFFLINILKNDNLLYLNSLILFMFVIFCDKLLHKEKTVNE
tara:strand:- start:1141 stop:3114 length:1974 start_codon:yes stop_codon:yes gene_type:complete